MSTTPFYKSFDDIFQDLLTQYKNLDSSPDVSVGSPVYIFCSDIAAQLWGLYRYQDYIAKQPFPDTASTDSLNHWGAIYGILRLAGETDSQYAQRIMAYEQSPPAGGTKEDYYTWATSAVTSSNPISANVPETFNNTAVDVGNNWINITQDWVNNDPIQLVTSGTLPTPLVANTTYYVIRLTATTIQLSTSSGGSPIVLTNAGSGNSTMTSQITPSYYIQTATILTPMSIPTPSEAGTVDVILVPNDENILYSGNAYATAATQLTTAVYNYIEARRPVTANGNIITMETILPQQISMQVGPLSAPVAQITADIDAYVSSLKPGDALYIAQLEAIAVNDGAVHATVLLPSADTYPNYNEAIRPSYPINVIAVS